MSTIILSFLRPTHPRWTLGVILQPLGRTSPISSVLATLEGLFSLIDLLGCVLPCWARLFLRLNKVKALPRFSGTSSFHMTGLQGGGILSVRWHREMSYCVGWRPGGYKERIPPRRESIGSVRAKQTEKGKISRPHVTWKVYISYYETSRSRMVPWCHYNLFLSEHMMYATNEADLTKRVENKTTADLVNCTPARSGSDYWWRLTFQHRCPSLDSVAFKNLPSQHDEKENLILCNSVPGL